MFLDDKLYRHVKNKNLETAKDFEIIINELFKICEDHFKPQLSAGMSYKEARVILDRTFNSWNLFISRLEKEEYFLIDIIKTASYKSAFMNNPELVEMYNKGRK